MSSVEEVIFGLCLVDFHHSRGPEIEYSYGLPEGADASELWPYLPFQALPDGSHSFEETFTYFTLLYNHKEQCGPPRGGAAEIPDDQLEDFTTLFAISCSRQIKSEELIRKSEDVTRSTVQKAVVVVSRKPIFGQIKDKLSIITNAFFLQRDFSNKSIIDTLYGNLTSMYNLSNLNDEGHLYVGLCLRRIVYDFKRDVLTILKAILLERRIMFFGSNVEDLCNLQFGFISLIPSLISHLQDCGSPKLNSYRKTLSMADSFKSSDRQSVLKFLGFPLQIFGKGGFFSSYTPLQQLDDLRSKNTNFYVVGTSNSLLLEQSSQLCDILINANTKSVDILSDDKSLHHSLQLTFHDKKWMDYIVADVTGTWNENDYSTPKNLQFEGSEDFIRWQFEDYLTGLLSSVKLEAFLQSYKDNEMAMRSIPEEIAIQSPIHFFNPRWVQLWKETQNFEMFNSFTDDRIFDLFPPKHVYNGTDTLSALQQKLQKSFQSFKKKQAVHAPTKEGNHENQSGEENQEESISRSLSSKAQTEEQTVWGSWKEYFNAKKKTRPSKSKSEIYSSTNSIALHDSTPAAIGTALLNLGLNVVSDDETDALSKGTQDDIESTEKIEHITERQNELGRRSETDNHSEEEFSNPWK
ncbi:LAFE_0H08416g1_1 [Lachancea fermentati]|uniref:LAFE_0H08416g1_1 n=1 Tax=Lachancea fermentati TaxID=4955 RepID=A0A1G4MK05_LACFM|nr:LAFE_0H08416g1_1 [Lachancea fermentati]